MRAYPLELRQPILRACDEGTDTRQQIAELFGVSRSFVQKLLRQREDTGRLAPQAPAGGRPPKLDAPAWQCLRDLVAECPDATLAELGARLQQQGGPSVHGSTLCRALRALGLPLKKKEPPRRRARHAAGASLASGLVAEGPTDRCPPPGFCG
jgi:putative transposase